MFALSLNLTVLLIVYMPLNLLFLLSLEHLPHLCLPNHNTHLGGYSQSLHEASLNRVVR